MLLVKSSYEIWSNNLPAVQRIERAGRVCYKSEDKITVTSGEPFCRKLLNVLKHESVFEHVSLGFQVTGEQYVRLQHWPFRPTNWPVSRAHLRYTANRERCVISGNIRAWRDTLKLRDDISAIAKALVQWYPLFFADLSPCTERYLGEVPERVYVYTPAELLEHETTTVKFIVDRGVTHELVRHRPVAYSQESTRYCNYGKTGHVTFVIPPWLSILPGTYIAEPYSNVFDSAARWYGAMRAAELAYLGLLNDGWSPQQARSVLPNSLKTEIVATATLRQWRHILSLRTAENAHPQMREVMCPLKADMQIRYPEIFNG